MALKINTAPSKEPLSILEVTEHLRIDIDDDDGLLLGLITAARQYCEDIQNRAYINRTYELWLDAWPDRDYIKLPMPPLNEVSVTAGSFTTGTKYRILTVGTTDFTLIGASANTVGVIFTTTGAGSGTGTATASGIITYYGTDNTAYNIDGADLFFDTKSEPGRICLAYGESWPSTTLRPYNGICVTFIAGYGSTPASVPQKVKQAMLLHIGWNYEHRDSGKKEDWDVIQNAVDALLYQDRIVPV